MKKLFSFIGLLGLCLLASCSSSDNDGPSTDPTTTVTPIDGENIKGEWILKPNSGNACKLVTISKNGSFNVADVTQGWNIASTNEAGTWVVDASNNTITGNYTEKDLNTTNSKLVTLHVSNQKANSFDASSADNEINGTCKRLLGEIKLAKGQAVVPECLPELKQKFEVTQKNISIFETKVQTITWEETAELTSMDPSIATVNADGLITAQGKEGVTFVDIKTSQGTSTIKVVVDEDYYKFFGMTREEIHDFYGTSTICVESISQIMYNYDKGDYGYLKFQFNQGKVSGVAVYFKNGTEIDLEKYKELLNNRYTFFGQQGDMWGYCNGATPGTSSVGVVLDNGDVKCIKYVPLPENKELFHDYSVALGKNKEGIYSLYSDRSDFSAENLIMYSLPNGFNDYAKKVSFKLEDGICKTVLVELQETVKTSTIGNYLLKVMTYKGTDSTKKKHLFYSNDGKVMMMYEPESQQLIYQLNSKEPYAPNQTFNSVFGKSKAEVKSTMLGNGLKFVATDYSYSTAGSDYYADSNNNIVVGFVFNDLGKMCEYWQYPSKFEVGEITQVLSQQYTENTQESTATKVVFYNNVHTLKITVDAASEAVVFVDLTQQRYTSPSMSASALKKSIIVKK